MTATRRRSQLYAWLPATVTFAAIVATLLLYYPGGLSSDGVAMYRQVIDGDWDNTKPVAMRHLWWLTDQVICGPGGIFLLQVVAYWGGIFLIIGNLTVGPVLRALLNLCVGFFPPLYGLLPHVSTSSQLMVASLLGLGLVLRAHSRSSPRLAMTAMPFLFYAGMLRHESLLGVIPVLYMASLVLFPKRSWVTTLALTILVAGSAQLVNRIGSRQVDIWAQLLMWDLAAISIASGEMLLPSEVLVRPEQDHNLERLEEHFSPMSVIGLFWADQEFAKFNPTRDANRRLLGTWLSTVASHPREYLAHRLNVFVRIFSLNGRTPWQPFFGASVENDATAHCGGWLRNRYQSNAGNAAVRQVLRRLAYRPIYHVWVYLLLNLGVFAVSFYVKHPHARNARLVATSGLFAAAPLPWILPSVQLRFTLWVIAAALIASLLLASAVADGEKRGVKVGNLARSP